MKFNKANTIKNPLRSLLAAVCAWAILVSLVLPVIATEVPETTPETTAETTAATEEATEATIPPTTTVITPVTTAETKGNSGLEEALRAEIAAYNDRNGISPEMPDSALANAYFALDSDGAKAAWEDAHGIIDRGANLTDAEADTLLGETNTKLFLRFYDVMQRINTPVMAAISGSENLQEGLTATGGSTFNWTVSASTISVKATPSSSSGCGGTSYSKQEDTLTLTIADGYTLKLTPTFSGQGTVTINSITPQSGSEYVYPAGTVTVTIASGSSEGADESLTLAYNCNSTSSSELEVLFNPVNGIPYTVNGEKVETEAVTVKALPADGYTINATSSSYGFSHGIFVDAAGTSTTMVASGGKLYPKTNGTITPFFGNDVDKDGVAPYLVDSAPYWDWEVAKNAAANGGKLIILNDDHTLSSGNYEIPSGITFLVPFDSANTLITDDMSDHIAENSDAKTCFRQLTMPSGSSITVNGTLCVGSKAYKQMTGQVGPYGSIVMDSGSSIEIESGAKLYAYGYIFPGNGKGTVSVKSGGTVYEDMMVMDYPGSASSTQDTYDAGVFPMRAFTVRNVEVPMTLSYGAKEYVFYHFYGTNLLVGYNGDYVLLIGESSESNPSPFSLEQGASLTKSYANGRQIISISGDSSINAITMKIKKLATVSSSSTSGFPIPSGFDIVLESGTVTLGDNVIMTEGSKITIGKDATVNTNGKNLYVFAKNEAGAVSATDVHGTSYGKVDADAILDVNGTLNVSGGLYISADSSSIISSKETGTVNIQNTISQTKVKIKTAKSASTEYDVYPAKLLNGNDSRVDIATSGIGVYKYVGTGTAGKWHKGCDGSTTETNTATCEAAGVKTVTCTCGAINTTTEVAALGHDYGEGVTTLPKVDTEGYITYTCSRDSSHTQKDPINVAQVGEQTYTLLSKAFTDVATDGTVTLLSSIGGEVEVSKAMTIHKGSYEANILPATGYYISEETDTTVTIQKRIIAGTSVRAGDCLDIYFWVTGLEGDGYTAKFSDGSSIPAEKWITDEATGMRRFAFKGITAKRMTETVSVTIFDSENKPVSETATESIEGYALRTLEKNSNTELRTALVDMLNYGADAQTYFNHNTTTLANAKLTEAQKGYGTSTDAVVENDMKKITETGDISFVGASVTAGNELYLSFYFIGLDERSNIKAVVTYTDHYGNQRTREIAGSSFVSTSGYWGPQVTGLAVADGRQLVNCKIYNGSTLVAEAECSIEGYAAKTIADNENNSEKTALVAVCKSLMKFVDSAYAYFH